MEDFAITNGIIRARHLMNDEGRHWIKGSYKDQIFNTDTGGKETVYCSVGALREAFGHDFSLVTKAASIIVEASDLQDIPVVKSYMENNSIRVDRLFQYSEELIIEWNDSRKSWKTIDRAFKKGAKLAKSRGL